MLFLLLYIVCEYPLEFWYMHAFVCFLLSLEYSEIDFTLPKFIMECQFYTFKIYFIVIFWNDFSETYFRKVYLGTQIEFSEYFRIDFTLPNSLCKSHFYILKIYFEMSVRKVLFTPQKFFFNVNSESNFSLIEIRLVF